MRKPNWPSIPKQSRYTRGCLEQKHAAPLCVSPGNHLAVGGGTPYWKTVQVKTKVPVVLQSGAEWTAAQCWLPGLSAHSGSVQETVLTHRRDPDWPFHTCSAVFSAAKPLFALKFSLQISPHEN